MLLKNLWNWYPACILRFWEPRSCVSSSLCLHCPRLLYRQIFPTDDNLAQLFLLWTRLNGSSLAYRGNIERTSLGPTKRLNVEAVQSSLFPSRFLNKSIARLRYSIIINNLLNRVRLRRRKGALELTVWSVSTYVHPFLAYYATGSQEVWIHKYHTINWWQLRT